MRNQGSGNNGSGPKDPWEMRLSKTRPTAKDLLQAHTVNIEAGDSTDCIINHNGKGAVVGHGEKESKRVNDPDDRLVIHQRVTYEVRAHDTPNARSHNRNLTNWTSMETTKD